MSGDAATQLELYKLYLSTAEKVSDRRLQANTWMLSVNSAVVGLYGYLGKTKESVTDAEKAIWAPSVIGRRWVNAGSSGSRILLLSVVCAAAAT